MNEPIKRRSEVVIRVIAVIGALLFVALAVKVGTESWHARSTNSVMPNWKGGTMEYDDGFRITAFLALFAAVWCYCAIRPKSIAEAWNRRHGPPRDNQG